MAILCLKVTEAGLHVTMEQVAVYCLFQATRRSFDLVLILTPPVDRRVLPASAFILKVCERKTPRLFNVFILNQLFAGYNVMM